MFDKERPLQDQYVDFMGTWMGGTLIGHILGKLIVPILIIWGLSKLLCS